MKSCKMTGNIGGQTVRCDLREGHGGNHHAVVEATREMQIETERDELHEHAEELSEALAVEREAHGATRRLLGLARAAEWQRKVAEAEAALNGHLVGVEDRSPEEQDASMAPWRADPPHEPALDDLRAKHARQRETIRGAQAALPSDILDASETLGGAITAALAQKDAEIAQAPSEEPERRVALRSVRIDSADDARRHVFSNQFYVYIGALGPNNEAAWALEIAVPRYGDKTATDRVADAMRVVLTPREDDLRAKHARQRETIRGAQAALPSDILDASETLGGAITAALAQKDAEIARLKAALDGTLVAPEPGEHDADLLAWHERRAPDVLERMRAAGAI